MAEYKDACINNNIECIRMLSEHICINCKDNEGNTPLHIACSNDSNIETIDVLVDLGADVHAINIYNQTPLLLCSNIATFTYLEKIIIRGNYDHYPVYTNSDFAIISPENISFLEETCAICYISLHSEFIHCSRNHYTCKSCWIKCNVLHCLYCYEPIKYI